MYFKINKKLLQINTYAQFNNLINTISSSNKYILVNNKHISQITPSYFNNTLAKLHINEITEHYKLQGGIISGIMESLMAILKLLLLVVKIIIWVIMFIIWLLRFVIWLLTIVIPSIFTNFGGFIKIMIYSVIDAVFGTIGKLIRKIFGEGITKDRASDPEYRCYGPKDDGTMPTTIIISTVLCPPLGVFMVYGLSGWVRILISAVLSLFYYIPGLVYSLLLFYS